MKALVVMTYYQLMHAIALALTFDKKPLLYFSTAYLNPGDELLDNIRGTGVFHAVIEITKRGDLRDYLVELRQTSRLKEGEITEIGNSLFEKYLEPYYGNLFSVADKNEEIYIYNDFQWHYYYIEKHFKHIIGVEDGYKSLLQQTHVHVSRGDMALLRPFIEQGFFPEPLYKSKKIEKIISSASFDELDDYYKELLFVWDFNEISNLKKEQFKEALFTIFGMSMLAVPEKCSLILSQPLDRGTYCTSLRNYLLNKVLIANEQNRGNTVFFKPHPAEQSDPRLFCFEGTRLLKKNFPIEVLNYTDSHFERLVSFGSTGAQTVTCAKDSYQYFGKDDASRSEIKDAIIGLTNNEKLEVDIFVTVGSISVNSFINVYSWVIRSKLIHTNIHICIKEEDWEEFSEYYSCKDLSSKIKEYRKKKRHFQNRDQWGIDLSRLPKWIEMYSPNIDCVKVGSFDEWVIYEDVLRQRKNYDYIMLVCDANTAFDFTKSLIISFKKVMPAMLCTSCTTTYINEKRRTQKTSISPGYIGDYYDGRLEGRLIHRSLMQELQERGASEDSFADIVNDYRNAVKQRPDLVLHLNPDRFPSKDDGASVYKERVLEMMAFYEDDEKLSYQLANIMYEYYNWLIVRNVNNTAKADFDFLDDLPLDKACISNAYQELAKTLLFEHTLMERAQFFSNRIFYQSFDFAIKKAARRGTFGRINNTERIRAKLRRELKRVKASFPRLVSSLRS